MLEKKAGNFLTDGDIRNIFNQFDRWASQPLRSLLLASVFGGCPPWVSHGRCCRDSNGYLGAHDLAIVYRSLGENLEDDLVILPARMLCGCAGVWVWVHTKPRRHQRSDETLLFADRRIDPRGRQRWRWPNRYVFKCQFPLELSFRLLALLRFH